MNGYLQNLLLLLRVPGCHYCLKTETSSYYLAVDTLNTAVNDVSACCAVRELNCLINYELSTLAVPYCRYLVPGAGAVWTWRQAGAPECTEWWVAGGLCWPGMGAGLLISPLAGLSSVQVPVLHRGHHTISWAPAAKIIIGQ